MRFWLDFFKDKRFSWDFKIANFIMGDSLRNYIATDIAILKEIQKNMTMLDGCANHTKSRLNKVINDLSRLAHK